MQEFTLITSEGASLTAERLDVMYEKTRQMYLKDSYPWVVGFSGGKDSSATLQLVWKALAGLPEEKRVKPVYVLSSDTLVETPVIVDYIDQTLDRINKASQDQHMPFQAHKVQPEIEDTFWVNLIGKGYPAPNRSFRWCTDRLKIKPANRFILNTAAKYGQVVVVLGVRKDESMTRAQSMSLAEIKGTDLRRHSTLPNAFVYAPIEDLITDEVWSYLLTVPCPWGNQNRDLLAMYRNASQAGECPLVVDTTTPSCGNSRFGCWVCTVVTKDRSMEALVDNGEEWLEPLLNLRDKLAETQDPDKKAQYRDYRRRGGQISMKRGGDGIARGPYMLNFCRELLADLLLAQESIAKDPKGQDVELIGIPELLEIRRIWRYERGDWEDSLPAIYRASTGRDIHWPEDDESNFNKDDLSLLEEICETEGLTRMVTKLIDTERQFQGMSKRSGIFNELRRVISEDWRTEKEFLEANDVAIHEKQPEADGSDEITR